MGSCNVRPLPLPIPQCDLDLVIIVRVVFRLGAGNVCLCGKGSRAEVDRSSSLTSSRFEPREFGVSIGADIQDKAATPTTPSPKIFEDNHCLIYAGAGPSPCPNLGEHEEDAEHDAVAAFVRNRLASQARVFNAVYRLNSPFLPKAARFAASGEGPASNSVTVTGKVVDAACFMMHAPAATLASHRDCGAACLARGVPLAIATDDGVLYFPADGNQRLKSLLNARVRASGTVLEKHDPMELKMPVGDKNQMVVRVEGGYKQITIQTLEKIPPAKRGAA